ncbi:MAG: Hsp20/alpha crystallin family protein [Candidatus Atribacteria bacterium]|jgi:HSP20 family protein|nr:Hsp20/alpha crystallin family protein [Candidatus Atribacteria bacterium]
MVNRSLPVRREDRLLRPVRRLWDVFDLRSDIDRMFDELFDFTLGNVPMRRGTYPLIDMTETDTEFILKAELPGIDPKNIDINVTPDRIEIRGEVKDEWEQKDTGCCIMERYRGTFERVIGLPAEVNQDGVKANYQDGILKITLPKTEPSKPKAKKVEIETK